jgi:uncharacterized protein YdaU (DUF1376 family)
VTRTEIAPAFQCYAADVIADSASMTNEQFGMYWRLALQSWREEGIPDDGEIAQRVGLSKKAFQKVSAAVLRPFTKSDARWTLSWQESQRSQMVVKRVKARDSANTRWERERAKAMRPDSDGNANASANALPRQSTVVASAVAVASPPTTPREELEKRFPDSLHWSVVLRFLQSLPVEQDPDLWVPTISGWLDGLGMSRGRAASAEDVATALTDYLTKPEPDFTPLHVRRFVDRVMSARLRAESEYSGPPVTEEARRVWALIKSSGIHHLTSIRQIEEEINSLEVAGLVTDPGALSVLLRKLDFQILLAAKDDATALRHITERLHAPTLVSA